MNWVDMLLLVIVVLSVWSGWQKGFILGSLQLVTWLGSVIVGFFFYQYLAVVLQKYFPSLGVWTMPLAFVITILIARLVLAAIINSVLHIVPPEAHHNVLNNALGMVPGFVNGMINAVIVSALLSALSLGKGITNATRDSRAASQLAGGAAWVDEKLSPIFNQAVKKTMNRLTVEPKSNETVKLPFTDAHPEVRPELEIKMLELVNEERVQRGLQPLKADPELTAVARAHSGDMFAKGYFSHYTPEGKDPFDRMRAAHIHFLAAGENLALGQTLTICHQGLMNSPGHRANILNPAFGRVGIGILDGGFYGLMIAQEFRN